MWALTLSFGAAPLRTVLPPNPSYLWGFVEFEHRRSYQKLVQEVACLFWNRWFSMIKCWLCYLRVHMNVQDIKKHCQSCQDKWQAEELVLVYFQQFQSIRDIETSWLTPLDSTLSHNLASKNIGTQSFVVFFLRELQDKKYWLVRTVEMCLVIGG